MTDIRYQIADTRNACGAFIKIESRQLMNGYKLTRFIINKKR